jgi:hypothetical protein
VVVVFVQTANGKQFLGPSHLTFDKTVFRTGARLQGQPAIGPELSLGAKTMWGLDQSHRQRPHLCRVSEDDRAIVLIVCWATVVMTPKRSAKVCVPATSRLGSPNETLIMAVDWADGDG